MSFFFCAVVVTLLEIYAPLACAETYRPCTNDELAVGRTKEDTTTAQTAYIPHQFTSRGSSAMYSIMPDFYNLSTMFERAGVNGKPYRVFENGCGSGRFLLEAQTAFPGIFFYGTNIGGYRFIQADGSSKHSLEASKAFNIDLMCHADGHPILPEINLIPSITSKNFRFPFPNNFFDLIVSRDALNMGKVSVVDSFTVIPTMLSVLKLGGVALMHLQHNRNSFFVKPTQHTDVLSVWNIPLARSQSHTIDVSVVMFKIDEIYFTIAIKKCDPSDPITSPYGDCILPASYQSPRKELIYSFPKVVQYGNPELYPKKGMGKKHVDFAFDYLTVVYKKLNVWKKRKYILPL